MNKDVQQAPDFTEDRHLDPPVKEFLKGINAGKPVESLSKEAARQVLSDAQSSVQVDLSGIVESEQTITENGLSVPLTVVRPQGSAGSPPCFVFIHGGGWILGDYPTHRRLVRDLVVASGFPAVFIHYTPSPEAKYPQALDEIYAAVRWIARNGARIGVDGSRMALAGNSVGGNMAIATALRAKREQGPQIKLLLPMWPVADSSFDTASYVRYAKAAIPDRFADEMDVRPIHDRPAATARGLCLPVARHGRRASRPAADLHSGSRKRHLARRGRGAWTQTVRGGRRWRRRSDTTE